MKVLLVEDSATVAAFVSGLLRNDPDVELLPVAADARTGVRYTREYRPDIVLMDVKLPDHDGVWAIEEIMAEAPCPVVVLSGHLSSTERDITFEALRAGAVDVMAKPTSLEPESRSRFQRTLLTNVKLMASAKVVRRNRPSRVQDPLAPSVSEVSRTSLMRIRRVLIGASTGGPPLLYRLLDTLPAPYPLPIVLIQHTLKGFDGTLAEWLAQTGHHVRVATEGIQPAAGEVWVSPADTCLSLRADGAQLVEAPLDQGVNCIDATFESAAELWGGSSLAVVLTGMGHDGAAGLSSLMRRGALTIVQRPETCIVPSMPLSAVERGAALYRLSPDELAEVLVALADVATSEVLMESRTWSLEKEG